jgi:hypothetical protein
MTSSGPMHEQHGQRLHEHRRGGAQRRRLLQPMLSQPQRRIGAGARVLAQATDHLDRCGIFGIEGREREHPQTRVAGGPGEPRQFATRFGPWRPARLPSRPRPTPRPASRSARAACPHPSLASSTSVRATCGSTSWSPAGSEPYPIPHAASSSRLMPSTRVAIATLVATPPRLSLSEHDQRARGRRQANPAATICWSPYSSPLTHAAMDAGLPPICVGQSSPLRVRRAVGRMTRVGQRSTVLHPVAS